MAFPICLCFSFLFCCLSRFSFSKILLEINTESTLSELFWARSFHFTFHPDSWRSIWKFVYKLWNPQLQTISIYVTLSNSCFCTTAAILHDSSWWRQIDIKKKLVKIIEYVCHKKTSSKHFIQIVASIKLLCQSIACAMAERRSHNISIHF